MKMAKLLRSWGGSLLMAAALLSTSSIQAAGLLKPSNLNLPDLELKDHQVKVVIEDGYAITTVDQVFHNPHAQDLEAIYSFPVPQHGAVNELTVWIDGLPVTGEVMEKQAARKVYEEEKAAGRDAGITEKDSYKTFDTSVSPVRAGQDTRVRIQYFQPAKIDTGIGRYVYPLEEGGVDEAKLAFWTANDKVTGRFSFDLYLRSAYPVAAVRVPNHPQAQLRQKGDGEWHIHIGNNVSNESEEGVQQERSGAKEIAAATAFTLDQDLVVYWRHKEGLPGSVDLIAHKEAGQKRGTFMLVVTPGDDLKPIKEGKDWVFVLDISGSMQGKYATLADGVERALQKLRPADRFRIILFNDRSHELTSGYENATAEAVGRYTQKVLNTNPEGGTNLFSGLKQGIDSLDADRTSAIVLVTDGVANVGETAQRKFIDLVKKKDVRLFTFVMGNGANRPMLESMTKASNGFAVSVSNSDDIVGQILSASSKVTHEALHGVKLKIKGVKTADITPSEIGSLYRGQQLVLMGHYFGDGAAQVTLSGKVSGEGKQYSTSFDFPKVATDNPEIERLWAYAKIESMREEIDNFGEKPDLKQAITGLGVEYGLVTNYTSMVVVRDEVFQKRGIDRQNQQRLKVEKVAQQKRSSTPPQSRRVDVQQPMYQSSRASHSGAGAIDIWTLMMLLPLLFWLKSRRIEEAG